MRRCKISEIDRRKKATFEKMTAILREAEIKKKAQGGRNSKLSIEDYLLMALEYIREYRTYFHVIPSSQIKLYKSNFALD